MNLERKKNLIDALLYQLDELMEFAAEARIALNDPPERVNLHYISEVFAQIQNCAELGANLLEPSAGRKSA